MRMKKENMDHIKERFENETGVKLPEKETFEMPAWTGRFIAAAAGLICLVGLGLVWNKISADKQESTETMLADGEEGYEVTLEDSEDDTEAETEENAIETETETGDPDIDEGSTESNSITIETDDGVVSISEEPGEDFDTDIFNGESYDGIQLFLFKNNNTLPNGASFSADSIVEPLIYPVPSELERLYAVTDGTKASIFDLAVFGGDYQVPKDGYYSVGANIGDDVLAMHDCTVTDTGFDAERGNYITTRFYDITIEYRHLDQVFISAGDTLYAGDKIATAGNTGRSTGPHLGITATADDGSVIALVSMISMDPSAGALPDDFYEEEPIED